MSIWNFDAANLKNFQSPLTIVKSLCEELSQMSQERVIARVTEYEGKYQSTQAFKYSQLIPTMIPVDIGNIPAFNVQEVMGDKATDDDHSNKFVYELFLTSKNTPKYKYRIFIMYYSIDMYPVGLTIQKDIAKEANLDSEGSKFGNEAEFKEALNRILGSATVGNVLCNLAALNS